MTKYKCGEFVKLPRDGLEEYFSGFEKNFTQIHRVFHTEAKIIKKKRTHHHHS